jgi:hypothetical protein
MLTVARPHMESLVDKLDEKVTLVTGASSGIGIDTVATLPATRADVYIPKTNPFIRQVTAASISPCLLSGLTR